MKNKNVKDEKKEKKIGLTTKIFIALLLVLFLELYFVI